MKKIDLTKYDIQAVKEIVYNPSYEQLFEEETNPKNEGFDRGEVTTLGAVNVKTGIYTCRSPKGMHSPSIDIGKICAFAIHLLYIYRIAI